MSARAGEVIVQYTNTDELTKEKLTELRCRIKSQSSPPHVAAVSEVKPKTYKRHLTTQEYNLEGHDMEVLNIGECSGKGMIIYTQFVTI